MRLKDILARDTEQIEIPLTRNGSPLIQISRYAFYKPPITSVISVNGIKGMKLSQELLPLAEDKFSAFNPEERFVVMSLRQFNERHCKIDLAELDQNNLRFINNKVFYRGSIPRNAIIYSSDKENLNEETTI